MSGPGAWPGRVRTAVGTGARAVNSRLPRRARLLVARVLRAGPDLVRRRVGAVAPRTSGEVSRVEVVGLHGSRVGLGAGSRLLVAELEQAGLDVAVEDLTGRLSQPRDHSVAAREVPRERPDASIVVVNPDTLLSTVSRERVRRQQGAHVVGFWIWELEVAPPRWAKARHLVHEVWSGSTFAAEAISRRLGQPVAVVPYPVALAGTREVGADERRSRRAALGLQDDGFLVFQSLSMGSGLARKNPFAGIRAFADAFGRDPGAHLVVRALDGDRHRAAARALRQAVRDAGANVTLVEDDPDGLAGLQGLYGACDAYLSPHRSEGFGLNLAEAMLASRPVVATGWSGNLDFMHDGCARLLPYELVPVRDTQGLYTVGGARWAEPDHDATVEVLRELRDDADLRADLGEAGRRHVLATLSGGAAARALRATTS